MTQHPDRIRVEQDDEGFWTCREALIGSQEYVRADLMTEMLAALQSTENMLRETVIERDLLRQAVVRYCDHSRMGTVEPMSVQQAIDDAFAACPAPHGNAR